MRILPNPGEMLVLFTYDPARIYQVLEQNRNRFGKRFVASLDAETVEAEDDSGRLERFKVEVSGPDGKKLVAVSLRSFIEKMVPQLEDALVIVYGHGARRLGPPPLGPPPRLKRSTAMVLMVESLDDVPEGWELAASDMVDAYFADEEEVAQVLGARVRELRGVLYGELLRLRDCPPEKWLQEADRMRNIRLLSVGLERMKQSSSFDELPLDGYFKKHLARHYGRPANIVFTGSPGSGKTTIAKAMASAFRNCYLLDAGRILERERGGFLAHALQTLQYISNVSLVINEMDHLVMAGRQYLSRFLSFLEENHSVWLAGTVIDVAPLMRDEGGAYSSELLRPGRIDEVIPVPPPFEKRTKMEIVRREAESLGANLSPDDIRRIASAAPLLYPSDYISLIQRFMSEGRRGIALFAETYDVEARRASILDLIDKCKRLGNTGVGLLEKIEYYVDSA